MTFTEARLAKSAVAEHDLVVEVPQAALQDVSVGLFLFCSLYFFFYFIFYVIGLDVDVALFQRSRMVNSRMLGSGMVCSSRDVGLMMVDMGILHFAVMVRQRIVALLASPSVGFMVLDIAGEEVTVPVLEGRVVGCHVVGAVQVVVVVEGSNEMVVAHVLGLGRITSDDVDGCFVGLGVIFVSMVVMVCGMVMAVLMTSYTEVVMMFQSGHEASRG